MPTFSLIPSKYNLIVISSIRVLIGLFPVVGNLYIGRFLNEQDFGDYFLFYFLATLVMSFYGLNIHSGYRRYVASKSEKIKLIGFVSSLFYLTIIAICNTGLMLIIILFFQELIPVGKNYILAIALFCYASVCISMFESFSIMTESLKFFVVTVIFPVILAWFFSVLYLQYTEIWLNRYLSFSIFIIFYLFFFLIYHHSKFVYFSRYFDYVMLLGQKFLKISIFLVLPGLMLQGFNYFDKLILDSYLEDFEFGQTSLVLQAAMLPFMAFKVIEMIYEKTMFAKYSQYVESRKLCFHFLIYVITQFFVAVLLVFLMYIIFEIIYLKQLAIDESTVFLLSLLQLSKLSFNLLIIFLLLTGKQKYALVHSLLFVLMWLLSIYFANSVEQYIGYTIAVTYASVVLLMFLFFSQGGKADVVTKTN